MPNRFPIPKAGEPIPEGWHESLIRFMNSLIPHGDGVTIRVNHTPQGVTISGIRQKDVAGGGGAAAGDYQHPFKASLAGEQVHIAGGYVFGYRMQVYLQDASFALPTGDGFFYIAVTPSAIDQAIRAEIIQSGKKEYCENGVYYFPLAGIADGVITQLQVGNLVTPFRKNYIPIIDESMQTLLEVHEGEGDEMHFALAGTFSGSGAPGKDQHLITNHSGSLDWEDNESDSSDDSESGGMPFVISESLQKLLAWDPQTTTPTLTIPDVISGGPEGGEVLSVDEEGKAVWDAALFNIDPSLTNLLVWDTADPRNLTLADKNSAAGPKPNYHLAADGLALNVVWAEADGSSSAGTGSDSSTSSGTGSDSSSSTPLDDTSYYILLNYMCNESGGNRLLNTHHIETGDTLTTSDLYAWARPLNTVLTTNGTEAYMWYICTIVPASFVDEAAADEYWQAHKDEYVNG